MIHGYEDPIVGIVAIAVGLLLNAAAITNWPWYYTMPTSRFIEKRLGRRGARILHAALGIGLIGLGSALIAGYRLPLFGR